MTERNMLLHLKKILRVYKGIKSTGLKKTDYGDFSHYSFQFFRKGKLYNVEFEVGCHETGTPDWFTDIHTGYFLYSDVDSGCIVDHGSVNDVLEVLK